MQATINSRTSGRECRQCSRKAGTSFPEQAIFYYLSLIFKCENRFNFEGYGINNFLKESNIAIEYEGNNGIVLKESV